MHSSSINHQQCVSAADIGVKDRRGPTVRNTFEHLAAQRSLTPASPPILDLAVRQHHSGSTSDQAHVLSQLYSSKSIHTSSFRLHPYLLALSLILLCSLAPPADALRFNIRPYNKKCLREEIHKDVLVTGEYELSDVPAQKTSISVTDSKGHTLFSKEDATKGKFAFTTETFDMFDICFETKLPPNSGSVQEREVFLLVKRGAEAKNYETMAQAEKLKPLEVELKRLEDLTESIVNDFAYMKAREEEMRDTNESTHTRVLYFSLFSMGVLVALAAWQVLYLRSYFKSKKLI